MKTIAYWWRASTNQRVATVIGVFAVVAGAFAWSGLQIPLDTSRGTSVAILGTILLACAAVGTRAAATANLASGTSVVALGSLGVVLHGVSSVDTALLGVGVVLIPLGMRERARTRSVIVDTPAPVFEVRATAQTVTSAELDGLTKAELYEKARALGIDGRSSMTKAELADAVGARTARAEFRAA